MVKLLEERRLERERERLEKGGEEEVNGFKIGWWCIVDIERTQVTA